MRRTSLFRQPKTHGFFMLKTNREVLLCNKNRQLNIFPQVIPRSFQVGDKEKSATFFTLKKQEEHMQNYHRYRPP